MAQNVQRAAELSAHLARRFPDLSVHRIARFVDGAQALTAKVKRHAERMCSEAEYSNQNSDPETGDDLGAERFAQQAKALLDDLGAEGVALELGGDPRGPCGSLVIDGLAGDGWGGDGFPVY